MRTAITVVASTAIFYGGPILWRLLGYGAREVDTEGLVALAVGAVVLGVAGGARLMLGAAALSLFSSLSMRVLAVTIGRQQFQLDNLISSVALLCAAAVASWMILKHNGRNIGALAASYVIAESMIQRQVHVVAAA